MRKKTVEDYERESTLVGAVHPTRLGKKVELPDAVYQLRHGPVPDGLYVCHNCDNRRCILMPITF